MAFKIIVIVFEILLGYFLFMILIGVRILKKFVEFVEECP